MRLEDIEVMEQCIAVKAQDEDKPTRTHKKWL